MDKNTVGARLRDARRRLRLSQSTVASHLHTSRQAIAAFEHDKRQPELRHLVGLANLYRLTLDELLKKARSAVNPTLTPSFSARFNLSDELLMDQDRAELVSFEQYLQLRPSMKEPSFKRHSFESIPKTIQRWRRAYGDEQSVPVQVFAMLARYGVEVRFTALEKLAGALLTGPGHPPGVLINSDQPYDRQRFSAAHELGHWVLDHPAREGHILSPLGRRFEPIEVHADQFAAEFLVPADLLDQHLTTLRGGEPVAHCVYRLASKFLVSFQAMTTRLSKLGVLTLADEEVLEKTKPGEVAKALGLRKQTGDKPFQNAWLPKIAASSLPPDWSRKAAPDTVRLLQEAAYSNYVTRVPEEERADVAGAVYEQVALWVAQNYPIVET